METILQGRCAMEYFTDLRLVFQAIGDRQRDFDWLITDLECIGLGAWDEDDPLDDDQSSEWRAVGPRWITGDELSLWVAEHDIQFVWAVLSGFPPGTILDLDRLAVVPYADGNPGFWVDEPRIQHPLAEVEIVCWDSGSTLLLCRDRSIGESFRRFFPEAVDLAGLNKARKAR